MLEKNLAFNLGGHINHSVFWQNLSPEGGGEPEGELAEFLKDQFGSFEGFKKHFSENATGIQGSGWSILGRSEERRVGKECGGGWEAETGEIEVRCERGR